MPVWLKLISGMGLVMGAGIAHAADAVPAFNVDPSCRAAAVDATVSNSLEICRTTERKARDDLVKLWPNVPAADKSECVPLSLLGGEPTYTELLTCLEMARDVRDLRKGRPLAPAGQAATTGNGTTGQGMR